MPCAHQGSEDLESESGAGKEGSNLEGRVGVSEGVYRTDSLRFCRGWTWPTLGLSSRVGAASTLCTLPTTASMGSACTPGCSWPGEEWITPEMLAGKDSLTGRVTLGWAAHAHLKSGNSL